MRSTAVISSGRRRAGGGGGDVGAHRYWRIREVAHPSPMSTDYLALADIEFRDSGGTDTITGGTASASSEVNGSFVAANAIDGNLATAWQSAIGQSNVEDGWWKYDYGAGNEAGPIDSVALTNRNTTSGDADRYMFNLFVIEYSDDDITWTPYWFTLVDVDADFGNLTSQQRVYSKDDAAALTAQDNSAHRYWRIAFSDFNYSVGTGNARLAEVELRATASGADETGSGTASASSEFDATSTADKAVDNSGSYGQANSWLSSGAVDTPYTWWQYDFGAGNDVDVAEVAIIAQDSNTTTRQDAPQFRWALLHSDDGTNWKINYVFDAGNLIYANGSFETFTVAADLFDSNTIS